MPGSVKTQQTVSPRSTSGASSPSNETVSSSQGASQPEAVTSFSKSANKRQRLSVEPSVPETAPSNTKRQRKLSSPDVTHLLGLFTMVEGRATKASSSDFKAWLQINGLRNDTSQSKSLQIMENNARGALASEPIALPNTEPLPPNSLIGRPESATTVAQEARFRRNDALHALAPFYNFVRACGDGSCGFYAFLAGLIHAGASAKSAKNKRDIGASITRLAHAYRGKETQLTDKENLGRQTLQKLGHLISQGRGDEAIAMAQASVPVSQRASAYNMAAATQYLRRYLADHDHDGPHEQQAEERELQFLCDACDIPCTFAANLQGFKNLQDNPKSMVFVFTHAPAHWDALVQK